MKNPYEAYDVTITISPAGMPATHLTVTMPGIKRSDILAQDYPSKGITAALAVLENSLE